jgi:hypothetical protein
MSEGPSNSVVNLGDLSKPADTLIKKVSKFTGGFFAPYQIKRIAKAEAEAAVLKAETNIQITDLHRRATRRFIEEEAQRQKNIEDITGKALPLLTDAAKPDAVEDDWITNFFDKCRIISDIEMQNLWSRVLAGEANAPGSFSKRTVNLLSDMDKQDAALFTALCGFCWLFGNVLPLIFDSRAEIYTKQSIDFDNLNELESIGVIKFDALAGFIRSELPKKITLRYYGNLLKLEMPNEVKNQLSIGHVLLTQNGQELARICGSKPVDGFWEYVQEKWKQHLPKQPEAPITPPAASASP